MSRLIDNMSSVLEVNEVAADRVGAVARALAGRRNSNGSGRAPSVCVRLTSTVRELLEAAKPEGQEMAEFLREAALTIALQRLEASQN